MAKGSLFLGQSRGKIGTVVNYVQGGEQRTRVYTAAGGRPGDRATLPARMQRVAFGSAANQWRLYSWLCTRMYRRGKKTKESDYNYFVRINFTNLPYQTKDNNLTGACCLMPAILSTGTYGTIYQNFFYEPTGQAEANADYRVFGIGNTNISRVLYSDTVAKWKEAYAAEYDKATKISIAYTDYEIYDDVIGGISGDVMEYEWKAIVLDLLGEHYKDENKLTVHEYLSRYTDIRLEDIDVMRTIEVCEGNNIFHYVDYGKKPSRYSGFYAIMFATNDNANDCYSTVASAANASADASAYRQWLALKTKEAMEVACESYGYTEGVMQTNIIEVGQAVEEIIEADAEDAAEEGGVEEGRRQTFKENYRKNVLSNISIDIKKLAEQVQSNKEAIAALEEQKKKEKEEKKK